MDLGLKGRVAVVAAASKGLGRATAEELAREGCELVVCARGEDALRDAAAAMADHGGRVVPVVADLGTAAGVAVVVERAMAEFGRADIVVANAGGPPSGPFEDHDWGAWQQAVELNLRSTVELVRPFLPGMRERRWGRILTITSIAVKQPVEGLILSNAIRAAVTGFARTLANEVAKDGVTVNNLLPGYTRTDRVTALNAARAAREGIAPEEVARGIERQVPMGRYGEPREFAALAAFLASDRASYLTAQSIAVDGGWIRSLL